MRVLIFTALESEDGEYSKINESLIPAEGSSTQGASYEYIDTRVQNRKTYYYKLEDIDLNWDVNDAWHCERYAEVDLWDREITDSPHLVRNLLEKGIKNGLDGL